jgi:thiamine pyrophosphate-dependent acetolactate synthase large subunit-like protein
MELTTLAKYGMPITHVVLDNGELGKISKEQRAGEWAVWQTSLRNPDFAALAELCGVRGFRVTTAAELAPALGEALAHPGPSLVCLTMDPLLV